MQKIHSAIKKLNGKFFKNKHIIAVSLIFTALIIAVSYFFYITPYLKPPLNFSAQKNLTTYADKIIKICSTYPLHQTCYDKEVPLLMDKPYNLSMADAFNVTALIQQKDPTYWYCHVLAHELSAKAIDENPDNWVSVVDSCPIDMCGSGCMHGAFQEHFKNYGILTAAQLNEVASTLNNICEKRPGWNPSTFNQFNCYHGLGHITMYLTNADIKKSISICDQTAVKKDGRNYLQTCYEGIFMQLYQPREPEDFALVKNIQPKEANLAAFCSQFSGEARNTCWREGWVLNPNQIQTARGILKFCSSNLLDESGKKQCLDKMISSSIITSKIDHDKINTLCQQFPQNLQSDCVMTIVATMVQVDKNLISDAASYCNLADSFNQGQACYSMYIYQANYLFKKGSADAKAMCSLLPRDLIGKCINYQGENIVY